MSTAFLNGTLLEVGFMQQPEGFQIKRKQHLDCKLKKSIWARHCWNVTLDTHLKEPLYTGIQEYKRRKILHGSICR